MSQKKSYPTLNVLLRSMFGERVQKIPLDAGFSCPNRDGTKGYGGCIYCDETGSGNGLGKRFTVKEQMIRGIEWARDRYNARKFIAYFQAFTNTYTDDMKRLYETIRSALISEDVVGVSVGTRPDCISEECLTVLKKACEGRLLILEIGLQSANDETLKRINRGHNVDDFVNAVHTVKKFNIMTCVHVIFGLPGETVEDMQNTIRLVKKLGIDGIKFHNLYIHRGTRLESLYHEGGINLISQDEYARMVAWSIKELLPNTVVHRLTGDPDKNKLIAPEWSLRKDETIRLIDYYLSLL